MNSSRIAAAAAGLAAACFLAACSATPQATSTSSPQSAAPSAQPGQGQGQGRGSQGQGRQGRVPGVQGLIAQVDGQTMQVQGDQGQTAVTWTDDTTFTRQAEGSADDIVVGSCVVAFGEAAEGSAAAPVTRVTLTDPVDGECSGGFGMGGPSVSGGTPPSGAPSDMPQPPADGEAPGGGQAPDGGQAPEGAPSGMPSGMPSGAPGGMGSVVAGKVASVDGDTVTVEPQGGQDAATSFTLTGDTAITATVKAAADDVEVGECAAAQGETDDVGAVTATTVRLSAAVDGACTGGRP
ncbi:MAG: hypothetical protein QM713_14670 [Arachnia sp.]